MDSDVLVERLQSLEETVKLSLVILQDELKYLQKELEKEKCGRRRAEADATSLRTRLAEMTKQNQASIWASFREAEAEVAAPPPPQPPPAPERQHFVGTSLLRNVDQVALSETDVHAISGATTKEITSEVKQITNCSHLYIVTGTNDIEQQDEDDIVSDLQTLLCEAKKVSNNITMTTLLNRADIDVRIKTDNVNKELRVMCGEMDITLANCDDFSLLRDGSVNTAIFTKDGYHLNKFGVDLLCKSLKVPLCSDKNSAFSQKHYPNRKATHEARRDVNTDGRREGPALTHGPPLSSRATAGRDDGPALTHGPPPSPAVRPFKGPRDPLSNFYPVQLQAQGGLTFHCACQLIQYRHARIAKDYVALERIMAAPDGPSVYQEAKKINPRNEAWLKLRERVITEVVHLKYRHCEAFRRELFNSRGKTIVEDTPSPFWGRGVDMRGLNKMGLILMSLRDNPPSLPIQSQYYPPQGHSTPTKPPQPSAMHLSWLSPGQRRYAPGSHPCAYCGERNHAEDRCRHGRPLFCDRCRSFGHKARLCPNLNSSRG